MDCRPWGIPGKKTWGKAKLSLGEAGLKQLQGVQVYLWEEPDAGVRDPKRPLEVLLRDQVALDLLGVLVIPAPGGFQGPLRGPLPRAAKLNPWWPD